jgi:hypothetical protein
LGSLDLLRERILRIMSSLPYLKLACDRCLRTERWGGSVVLMVVDAALTSSGLSYFDVVVPRVKLFADRFVENGHVVGLRQLSRLDIRRVKNIWRNTRLWRVAKNIAANLTYYGDDDREALRNWASRSSLHNWRRDPIGSIKGVGLVTYQYLRMMGGVDTIMPDRVVKKVVNRLLADSGFKPFEKDMDFIENVTEICEKIGVRPTELCWMTWLIEGEEEKMRTLKDPELLLKI